MNEIKKCSVSGVGFIFEKDAYNALNNYLQSLKAAYCDNSDKEEILADIEARVAELILSAQSDVKNVVCLPLVENIIAQLGSPEDISGEEKCEEKREVKQAEKESKSVVASFVSTIGRAALIVFKIFLGLMLFPLLVSILSLLIAIVGVITSSASLLSFPLDDYGSLLQVVGEFGAPMMVLAMLLILVPMLYVLYLFIVLLLNKRPRLWVLLSAFVLWIMMLVGLCLTAINYAENKSFDYFLNGGEIERIMKTEDTDLSRQIRDALDAEPTPEERAEWEKLLYDANAKSIDKRR